MPELFCHDILKADPKFQVKEAGIVVGVLPCCPWCQSNSGVSFKVWECNNVQSSPRAGVHTDSSKLPLLGIRYYCKNKECFGEVPNGIQDPSTGDVTLVDKKSEIRKYDSGNYAGNPMMWRKEAHKQTDHTFVIWNKKCFEQFPVKVQRVFSCFVFGLAHDYKGTEPVIKRLEFMKS